MKTQGHDLLYDDIVYGNKINVDCENWYVLSTLPGSEIKIKNEIGKLLKHRYDLYIPRREMFHKFQGQYRKVVKPLFPGYIFVYKEIEALLIGIRNSHLAGSLHPVLFDHRFAMVCEREMALLMEMTGSTGLVKTSQAILNSDRTLAIINGPLKYLAGSILYYDQRKRKASIKVSLLDKDIKVTLGLEILNPARHSARQPCRPQCPLQSPGP